MPPTPPGRLCCREHARADDPDPEVRAGVKSAIGFQANQVRASRKAERKGHSSASHCVCRRPPEHALFSENFARFFRRMRVRFASWSANFSYSIDCMTEFRSCAMRDNAPLTMFAQKGFI